MGVDGVQGQTSAEMGPCVPGRLVRTDNAETASQTIVLIHTDKNDPVGYGDRKQVT